MTTISNRSSIEKQRCVHTLAPLMGKGWVGVEPQILCSRRVLLAEAISYTSVVVLCSSGAVARVALSMFLNRCAAGTITPSHSSPIEGEGLLQQTRTKSSSAAHNRKRCRSYPNGEGFNRPTSSQPRPPALRRAARDRAEYRFELRRQPRCPLFAAPAPFQLCKSGGEFAS